ncbi:TPA: hypothetical protein DEP86_02485, partial [Candidatus Uhrbacteria bacterium]|nr:hypothetical protein [Candidatus Uhrbacteria bacterium]
MRLGRFGNLRQKFFDSLLLVLLALAPLTTGYIFYHKSHLEGGASDEVRGVLFATQLLTLLVIMAGGWV